MEIKVPIQIKNLSQLFFQKGHQLFIVGGVVRDLFLGKSIKDWDFTTDATPEQILQIIPEGFNNNQFGTVGLSTDLGVLEITTMRKESDYQDFRHPQKVEWTNVIEHDLQRRDFTINAMAYDLEKNKLIDPYNGKKDLSLKMIRAVGEADKRFNEDALRLLRAIRFATSLNFEIEPQTFDSIKKNAHLITHISNERIRDELLKILSSDNPTQGILLLKQTGLLKFILPELEKCFGLIQEGPKHDRVYDIGEHSISTLKHTPSEDPIVRLAALLHDVGKPNTKNVQADGNVTFYGHEIIGGKIVKEICHRLKFSNKDTDKIYKLVRYHMFTIDEHQTDSAIRRFIRNIGQENIDDMIALRIGDRLGGGTQNAVSWRLKRFRERIDQILVKPFSITDLKVNGQDVMEILQIPPSRKVGEILDQLFKEVLEDDSKNQREYLLLRIKSLN